MKLMIKKTHKKLLLKKRKNIEHQKMDINSLEGLRNRNLVFIPLPESHVLTVHEKLLQK